MSSSSKLLLKINFAIFSCCCLGSCYYDPSYFATEYLERPKTSNIESDNNIIIGLWKKENKNILKNKDALPYFLQWNINNQNDKSGKNDFIKQYSNLSSKYFLKYFEKEKLSIPENFYEIIKTKAQQLKEDNHDNILFYLVTYVIDAIHILEQDPFLTIEQKEKKIEMITNSYYKTIDFLVFESFELDESHRSHDGLDFFSYEEILSKFSEDTENVYCLKSSINNFQFKFLQGRCGKIIEDFFIKKIRGNIQINTVESLLGSLSRSRNEKIKNYFVNKFECFLKSFIKQKENIVNENLKLVEYEDFFSLIKKSKKTVFDMIHCLKQFAENSGFIININDYIDQDVMKISIKNQETLFNMTVKRDNNGEITNATSVKFEFSEFYKKKHPNNIQNLDKIYEKFKKCDKIINEITGFSQILCLKMIVDKCNDSLKSTPFRSIFSKKEIADFSDRTLWKRFEFKSSYEVYKEKDYNYLFM